MSQVFWLEPQTSEASPLLRAALQRWGFAIQEGSGDGTFILVADRPSSAFIPFSATEILWWVKEGSPEEVSEVLSHCPGWVIRQDSSLEAVKTALQHLRNRDLGSEGWLRQTERAMNIRMLERLMKG